MLSSSSLRVQACPQPIVDIRADLEACTEAWGPGLVQRRHLDERLVSTPNARTCGLSGATNDVASFTCVADSARRSFEGMVPSSALSQRHLLEFEVLRTRSVENFAIRERQCCDLCIRIRMRKECHRSRGRGASATEYREGRAGQ